MAKYSTEYKLKVVQEYLAGHGSYETLSKRYHVPRTPFQRWVKAYKTFGVDGLKPSHTKKIYTFEFKRSAVECYQMKSYTKRLKEERIFQSMSRKGNCLNNSVMENFFGLLKQEIYYGRVYHSYGRKHRAA